MIVIVYIYIKHVYLKLANLLSEDEQVYDISSNYPN